MTGANKRKFTRFDPDQNTLLTIVIGADELIGLVFSEAYGGAAGALVKSEKSLKLMLDDIYEMKIGEIHYPKVQIKWIDAKDENLVKFGLQIID